MYDARERGRRRRRDPCAHFLVSFHRHHHTHREREGGWDSERMMHDAVLQKERYNNWFLLLLIFSLEEISFRESRDFHKISHTF